MRHETSLTTALPLSFLFSDHLSIIWYVVFSRRVVDMLIVTNHRHFSCLSLCYCSMQCHLDAIRYSFNSGSYFRTSSPRGCEAPGFQARYDRDPLLHPAVCLWNYSKFPSCQTKEPVPFVVSVLLSPCVLVSLDSPESFPLAGHQWTLYFSKRDTAANHDLSVKKTRISLITQVGRLRQE